MSICIVVRMLFSLAELSCLPLSSFSSKLMHCCGISPRSPQKGAILHLVSYVRWLVNQLYSLPKCRWMFFASFVLILFTLGCWHSCRCLRVSGSILQNVHLSSNMYGYFSSQNVDATFPLAILLIFDCFSPCLCFQILCLVGSVCVYMVRN